MDWSRVKADLTAAIQDGLQVVIEIGGSRIVGNSVAVKSEAIYGRYGMVDGYQMSVKVLADSLPATLKPGDRLLVNSRPLRLLGMQYNPPAATLDFASLYGKGG